LVSGSRVFVTLFLNVTKRDRQGGARGRKMRKLLRVSAAIVAVSVSASAHAEPKRDILGFHPGMPYQEAMTAMAKIL